MRSSDIVANAISDVKTQEHVKEMLSTVDEKASKYDLSGTLKPDELKRAIAGDNVGVSGYFVPLQPTELHEKLSSCIQRFNFVVPCRRIEFSTGLAPDLGINYTDGNVTDAVSGVKAKAPIRTFSVTLNIYPDGNFIRGYSEYKDADGAIRS